MDKNSIACPFCGYELDSVAGGYECLRCGAAVFPGDQQADPFEGWQSCYLEDVKQRPTKRTGGSRKSSIRRKKPDKLLPSERWRLE